MAKFKYNGDHVNMSCFGLTFRVDGENVEAETDDAHILGKLRGNSHFDEIDAEDDDCDHVSTDFKVGEAVELVEVIGSLEELKTFAAADERKTVMEAADKRAAELSALED